MPAVLTGHQLCVSRQGSFTLSTALSISAPALRTAPQSHTSHQTAAGPGSSCQRIITPHKPHCQASHNDTIQEMTFFIIIKHNLSGRKHVACDRLQNTSLPWLFYDLMYCRMPSLHFLRSSQRLSLQLMLCTAAAVQGGAVQQTS